MDTVLGLYPDKECIQPITLLLLDINMPVMDGLKTTKSLKEKIDQINKDNGRSD